MSGTRKLAAILGLSDIPRLAGDEGMGAAADDRSTNRPPRANINVRLVKDSRPSHGDA
jgi:hypothetical protein